MLKKDANLTPQRLLELSNAQGIVDFFQELRYNTDIQRSDATDRATQHQLHRHEDLNNKIVSFRSVAQNKDETNAALFVYLYVLKSMTKKVREDIVNDLLKRNSGNYLLVLTTPPTPFKTIEFVFIDRFAGSDARQPSLQPSLFSDIPSAPISSLPPQIRLLSLERLHPDHKILRFLRDIPYHASLVGDQCRRISYAYDNAETSQEFFNNRSLFSDHYLKERLPLEVPEWLDSADDGVESDTLTELSASFRLLYARAAHKFSGKSRDEMRTLLFEPALAFLGFAWQSAPAPRAKKSSDALRPPDYVLSLKGAEDTPLAVCVVYPWERNLDEYPDSVDDDSTALDDPTASENPSVVAVSLLAQEKVSWVILTNGRTWRLYTTRARSRATNSYEVDLLDAVTIPLKETQLALKAFRYFWLFFRAQAFLPTPRAYYETPPYLSFLDFVMRASESYARRLGNDLKDRIFEEVFPCFAEGFVRYAQDTGALSQDLAALSADQRAALLQPFFDGTLIFLYRLLVLLYAESRDLLPLHDVRYSASSLNTIKQEIRAVAGDNKAQTLVPLKEKYHPAANSIALYTRLQTLFKAIDKGNPTLNVPVYDGDLFITEVAEDKPQDALTADEKVARFLLTYSIPDQYLALGLDLLAREEDDNKKDKIKFDLVYVDYKSLGVRQLGSIYEGLLEFKLRIAVEHMVVLKGKVLRRQEAIDAGSFVPGKTRGVVIYEPNKVYIENDRHERKASGSYYTPDYIVKYIIEQTVGPILDEKFLLLGEKFREFQRALLSRQQTHQQLRKDRSLLQNTPTMHQNDIQAIYQKYAYLAEELFDIKVLDPAMGSGHFLVDTVDYITDKMTEFLRPFTPNPVHQKLQQIRALIEAEVGERGVSIDRSKLNELNLLKRQVLKRCVFGVDLNPMAVKLTKVSLWLDTFTQGAPFSFLDYHLKWGNSLLGCNLDVVEKALQGRVYSLHQAKVLSGTSITRLLSLGTDSTPEEVHEAQQHYEEALEHLRPHKHLMNVWVSEHFDNKQARETVELNAERIIEERRSELEPSTLAIIEKAQKIADKTNTPDIKARNFFHWDLEFPEVFFGENRRLDQEKSGFDAVVGNPPYDVLAEKERNEDLSLLNQYVQKQPTFKSALGGKIDLFRLFMARSIELVRRDGYFGQIVPMSLLADRQAMVLRKYLLQNYRLVAVEAFPQKDDPNRRVFPEAKLPTCIVIARNKPDKDIPFFVITHPGKMLEEISGKCAILPSDIEEFDKDALVIPMFRSSLELNLAKRLSTDSRFVKFSKLSQTYQGEINETTMARLLSNNPNDGPKVLRGGNVQRYEFLEEAKQGSDKYLKLEQYKKGTKGGRATHSTKLRIGYQRNAALDNWRRLIFGPLPDSCHCFDSISYLLVEGTTTYFYLAILNSSLSEWRFRLTSSNNHVSTDEIGSLPIPHINFVTSLDQRFTHLQEAKRLLQQCTSDDQTCVTSFVKYHLAQQPEASDIVHDLLAFLAEDMIRLNKEKSDLQKEFLNYVTIKLQIQQQPDKKTGKTGLDALPGKSGLVNYPGDYQKGEDITDFDEIKKILLDNKQRFMVYPSEALLRNIEEEYEKNIADLKPFKQQLSMTDDLIDEVVYRLYGLTEQEITIVKEKTKLYETTS